MFGDDAEVVTLSTKNQDSRISAPAKSDIYSQVHDFLASSPLFLSLGGSLRTSLSVSSVKLDLHGGDGMSASANHHTHTHTGPPIPVTFTGGSRNAESEASNTIIDSGILLQMANEANVYSTANVPAPALLRKCIQSAARADRKMDVFLNKLDKLEGRIDSRGGPSTFPPSSTVASLQTHREVCHWLPAGSAAVQSQGFTGPRPIKSVVHGTHELGDSGMNGVAGVDSNFSPTRVSPTATTAVLPSEPAFTQTLARADAVRITVQLGDEVFEFDPVSVPDVPSMIYSTKLDLLFKHWDTTKDNPLLVVEGRGIPVKYWPKFYNKRKGVSVNASSWANRKGQWNTWKFIMEERERFQTDEEFWARWSHEPGKRFNFQSMKIALQGQRSAENKRYADEARTYFADKPGECDKFFRYTKGGHPQTLKSDASIADKWRKRTDSSPSNSQADNSDEGSDSGS